MLSDMNNARSSKATEIVEEYLSSLQDLKTNSKPQINLLTILAEDYIEYASAIVEAVEDHLEKVRSEVKLPVLYLIDSIVKNVNGSYLNLFAKNIVQTFCDVFEKVDENTRARMWKLRQTWNEIFPPKILNILDVKVHSIDPAWPISSSASSGGAQSKSIIHVNPKFLSMQPKVQPKSHTQSQLKQSTQAPQRPTRAVNTKSVSDEQTREERMMREELLKKQKELLELQKQKLQLEMLQKQKHLEATRIHVKPELVVTDGTLKKPILTTVPSDITSSPEKSPSTPTIAVPVLSEPKVVAPSILPLDPRIKTSAILQNGDSAVISVTPTDDTVQDSQPDLSSSETSSTITASPVKARSKEIEALASCFPDQIETMHTLNDNKNMENDRTVQRSSSSNISNQKQVITSDTDSKKHSPKKTSSRRSSSKQRDGRRKSSRKSSSSSSPHKKSSKSRKRSPTSERHHHRSHHHHHRRHSPKPQQSLDEEEQFGSLIISPPQPTTNVFKDRRDSGSSTNSHRNKRPCRRSSSRSKSPESGRDEVAKRRDSTSSKDEDLRASLIAANTSNTSTTSNIDAKEDLDLRVLPMASNKRHPTDTIQTSSAKKSKIEETFDDLFGKEDVDLRLLTPAPPKVVSTQNTPPTPPPPVISSDKDSWAKFKTPTKSLDGSSRSDSFSRSQSDRSISDRNRERSNRKFYNKQSDDMKDRGRRSSGRDYERNADRNIEIIMKEAAEELNQGTITKAQYNKLIQDVLHMSEDEKLRAAQRKERESKIWDRSDKGVRMKEHSMHSRSSGPRWQSPWHQPWAHPPGPFQGHFRPEFRPMGPWQNHPRLFGGPMRPDFHQFHAGFSPRLNHPPMGPNGPLILPNGPINPMTGGPVNPISGPLGPIPSGMMLGTGGPIMPKRPSPNSIGDDGSTWSSSHFGSGVGSTSDGKSTDQEEVSSSSNPSSDELPPADPNMIEEIAKNTMRSINIDNIPREIRYYGHTGVIFMHWDDPRDIGFQNGARRISIDGKDTVVCSFNDDYREFTYEGEVHKIKLGAPTRELYVDDKWYQIYFGGQPITVDLGNKKVSVKLDGPPPQVKIGTTKRTDLVLGKINLIINARTMVPVFLDSKPQMFHIEDRPCTLEFRDALQTVLLNGRPFNVEFGGLPKPIVIGEKKHFVRFSVLPRGFRAGYVKIAGMKGEQPMEIPADNTVIDQIESEIASSNAETVSSLVEPDSTSQDGLDHSYTSKSDLQLDVLSSVVPSAMAPSSGLSYQAEPVENATAAPTVTLPLNLNELFQRLVETGIVSNLSESKKSEDEEKKAPEIIPVSFDKPETLKIKNPALVTAIYSGIQCSSCGARFAPEMATRYSRHLDWHFRQNRRERDSSRKAHSRLWYYDVSDWIQFEEIEDLEDRAQSWFETEKQTMEIENAAAEDLFAETMQPSVPTSTDEDSCCQVCHEAFEQFYNDEKEEWHLRPAITFEDKNFHPVCLEDHKRTLKESAAALDISELKENNNKDGEIINVKNEDVDNIKNEDIIDIKNEDNVNENLGIQTDDDRVEEKDSTIMKEVTESMEIAHDILTEIINAVEQRIESKVSNAVNVEQTTEEQEIKDEESELELSLTISNELEIMFAENSENIPVEVTTEKTSDIEEELLESEIASEEKTIESAAVDSTQVEVKSTIDGNVELESTASTIPTTTSKIKLNITKPINSPKESKESKDEKEVVETIPEEEESTEPLLPASIKPALRERNLSVLPPVDKGVELSALCSIM